MTADKKHEPRAISRRRFLKGSAVGAGVVSLNVGSLVELGGAEGNGIVTENQLAGTNEWFLPFVDDSIEGFATEFSVNAGQTVRFKVKTESSNYRVDIFRIGWYSGLGGRRVATISPSAPLPQVQPEPFRDDALGFVDCGNWAVSASWEVPAAATSGVYVAHLVRQDVAGEPTNWIFFVVRNDGVATDMLVQTSDTTYQAYNRWGGSSLYATEVTTTWGRAVKVSYNRPMLPAELENDFPYAELPLVRWLERNGYDVAYTTGVDTERRPAELLRHKVFVSSGHDEYWSHGMRSNVEAARDAGVNLVFMTGNEMFWKVRWEPSADGTATPYRTLVCYKETLNNAKIDPSSEWTGTWRDPRFSPPSDGGRAESELTGTLFKAINPVEALDFAIEVPHAYSGWRFWRNTSVAALEPGSTATLTNATLGYEWNTDADLPGRPAGLIRLSETTAIANQVLRDNGGQYTPGPLTHYLTMYRASSGALVWSTGTVQWAWGLDEFHTNRPTFLVPADVRVQQATMNALADMGVQPSTRQSELIAATASTDLLPPVSQITSPLAGSNVPIGSVLTVVGTAIDAGGGRVAAVEVSVDDGGSWHRATGRDTWSYTFVPTVIGALTVRARGIDDSCNIEVEGARVTLNAVARTLPGSLWNQLVVPDVISTDDASPLELGVRFKSAERVFATGVQFYKGVDNVGVHVGRLWSSTGSLLAAVTFGSETASGWQQANFADPVELDAGATYVVSYSAPNGRYSSNSNYFATRYELAPLTALAAGDGGGNGVFSTTPGSFPTLSFGAANYWVDVVVDTDDQRAPRVSSTTPGADVTQVAVGGAVSAIFSESMDGASIECSLEGPGGLVPGTVAYEAATRTVRFVPDAPLPGSTRFVATVVTGSDLRGTPMAAPFAWAFTTAGLPGSVPTGLWTSADTPIVASAADSSAIEVGVKFRTTVAGFVSGIRFYKGANNSGLHVGHLWSASGDLLATATFVNESATGWQEARFVAPVTLTPVVDYVVSYFAPQGSYSADSGYFNDAERRRGPLVAPAGPSVSGNGVFTYGPIGGFPSSSINNTNYWVDVVFDRPPDVEPPSVVSTSPATGLQAVAVGAAIGATFDKAVDPATVVVELSRSGGSPVTGATTVTGGQLDVTFQPQEELPPGTSFVASVAASSSTGFPMVTPYSWTFTTATRVGESPATLWDTSANPEVTSVGDVDPIEVGVKFRADVDGAITGVRFFKGVGNNGPHVGHLWTDDGVLLSSANFTAESRSGWQQSNFPSPVGVIAGRTYVASYHAPAGRYAVTASGLQTATRRAPLIAVANNTDGGNGVFAYGPGSFPNQSFGASNYWVDVVFSDDEGPALAARFPEANAVEVDVDTIVAATFGEDVVPAGLTFDLRDSQGALVAREPVQYDSSTRTASIRPSTSLRESAVYTASVGGAVDSGGNASGAVVSWSFTTRSASALTLFGNAVPAISSAPESSPIEVGTRFSVASPVDLLGLRFYRGSGNTGTHIGSVWTPSGTLLAEVTFSSNGPDGWQLAVLPTPLRLGAGDYVVSYFAPGGRYAVTSAFFSGNAVVNGPLSAPASAALLGNGLFRDGGGFPTDTFNATNYWVDVLVKPPGPVSPPPGSTINDAIPTRDLRTAVRLSSGG